MARLTSSQLKRARAMVQTVSDSSSSLLTPPSALRSSSASSSMTSTTSSMVMTPTRRSGVEHRGCDEIVLAEHARHLFLVVQDGDAAAVLVDQLGKRHRAARAQQDVERDRALPMLLLVDDVDLVEAVGQIGRLAHVVDRLADGPVRRHRDELGLHPAAGGIFRIKQAALERDALRRRQLLEDLLLLLLVEAFQQLDRVVGFELADALGNRLRSSSSRISSRTASSTSFSAEKSKSGPVSSTRRTRSSGSSAPIRSPRSASCSSATQARSAACRRPRSHARSPRRIRGGISPSSSRIGRWSSTEAVGGLGTVHMFIHGAPRRLTGWSEMV